MYKSNHHPIFFSVYCKWFIDVKINSKRRKILSSGKFIKISKMIEFNYLSDPISVKVRVYVPHGWVFTKTFLNDILTMFHTLHQMIPCLHTNMFLHQGYSLDLNIFKGCLLYWFMDILEVPVTLVYEKHVKTKKYHKNFYFKFNPIYLKTGFSPRYLI